MEHILATYHKDCIDGTAAAAVLLKKLPEAKCFPLAHSYTAEDIAPILAELSPDTICYTLDSGLGAREMLLKGCSVTTIDHHMGAKEEFETLAAENQNYTFIFDNDKSGASLSWSYFFGGAPLPRAISLIEDSDLWRHQYGEETKHANNYLSMFRNDPSRMLSLISGDLEAILEKGSVITLYADKAIEEQILIPEMTLRIGEYEVPAYNITVYQSASGNILSGRLGKAVALFTLEGDRVKISFRSKDGHEPSSLQLATLLGGGGHINAAGATISWDTFKEMLKPL